MYNVKSENPDAIMYSTESDEFAVDVGEVPYAAMAAMVNVPASTPTNVPASAYSQAGFDAKLFSTLCEIDEHNYLYLFERCKAFNVNSRQLRYLEKEHIRRIIPPDQIGILAEFEHFHGEWRKQFLSHPMQTTPSKVVEATVTPNISKVPVKKKLVTPVAATVTPKCTSSNTLFDVEESIVCGKRNQKSKCSSSPEHSQDEEESNKVNRKYPFPLDKIIKNDLKRIQIQYQKNGVLLERDRRLLASALINYFHNKKIHMSRDVMECLAVQISEIFPTESKNNWHDVSGSNRRRGRLTLKLYNSQRTKRIPVRQNKKQLKPTETKDNNSENDETTQDECTKTLDENVQDSDAERIQFWLKNNKCEDNEELFQMWIESTHHRAKQSKSYETEENASTGAHVSQVLESWPVYKNAIGPALISIDFNHMWPKSESNFNKRWPIFLHKALKLYKVEYRDAAFNDLVNYYQENVEKLTDDTKNCILLHLFHALIRPIRPIHARQAARRYSVVESQSAFCRFISDTSEMDYYNESFPYIFIVGTVCDVQRCFVALRDVRYERSFVDAFVTCFQILMTFKLHFPHAAMNFWTFVQAYLFDMTPESGTNMSVVETIINYMLMES